MVDTTRLRITVDTGRFTVARRKAVQSSLWLTALLVLGSPAEYWWQRLMLFAAVPVALVAANKIGRARRLRPRDLHEELAWQVSAQGIQLLCMRDGEEVWRHTATIPKGCEARPGFVFHDDEPDGATDRYEVFIELHGPDGAEKHTLLTPEDTRLQLDKPQVIRLVEMLAQALGKEEELREETELWKQRETMPTLLYREGEERFVLQGRTLRFEDVVQERHWRTDVYRNGTYKGTGFTLELTLATGEQLRATVDADEPESVHAWSDLTRALEQRRSKKHQRQLREAGETVFEQGSKRLVFVRGDDGVRAFLERKGERAQVARVLAYKSLDRPVFVFVDQNGMKIAVQPGSFDEQEGLFALMKEAGVPMVLLDHSPVLSLWLRARGFRTDGEHPVQAIFYRFFRRLWWRALVPLALLYHALFSGALMVRDEVTHRYLPPAEKWLGLSAPDWLDIPVAIILLALSWYVLVWIGTKIGKS